MGNTIHLPVGMPERFLKYGKAESEQELFEALAKTPLELVDFFEQACEDETWSSQDHPAFTKMALAYFEKRTLQNGLPISLIYRVADVIQYHHRALHELVSRGVRLHLKDKVFLTSGLLMVASSDYFLDLLKAYANEVDYEIKFPIDSSFFKFFDEYLFTTEVDELWKENPEMLHRIMDQARKWDLEELAILCETVLKRYIDRTNVFEILLAAHAKGWFYLKNACIDFINQMNLGIVLEKGEPNQLICRLRDLKFHTLDDYTKVQSEVTMLQFAGSLPGESGFNEIISATPKLRSLDLSESNHYEEAFQDLPSTIQELILNRCPWIDAKSLSVFAKACPNIHKLHLVNNQQLDISAYAQLQSFPKLQMLNLARCGIKDDGFKVVMAAARSLEEVNLSDCADITPFGFTELARVSPSLQYIYASRTEIDNGSLAEIGEHCKRLAFLDISRCGNITSKGIQEIVRLCPTLRTLVVTGTQLSGKIIDSLKAARPLLTIVQ